MGNSETNYSSPSKEVNEIYSICSHSLIRSQSLRKGAKVHKDVLRQLFESFTRCRQYTWSEEIVPLFLTHFLDKMGALWDRDREEFYKLMLENSGMAHRQIAQGLTYEEFFYSSDEIRMKPEQGKDNVELIDNKIKALNYSIVDESEGVPFVIHKRFQKRTIKAYHSLTENNDEQDFLPQLVQSTSSQFYDGQILRSSVIVPETVFVQRLDEESKQKVNDMLDFYKSFSQSLQQMIRSVSLIACPLKHFEIALKKKVSIKNIKKATSTSSLHRSPTKHAALLRKKQEYNNTYLLYEIRDFTEAYTEFIWKYLNLYRITETEYSTFITIETAYAVVLKTVWSFSGWIGERGYDWEERQIPEAMRKLGLGQAKGKRKEIVLEPAIVDLGCALAKETNPQKYLKQIVILYRQLSKKCSNADELILFYQALFVEICRTNSHQRLFRMQSIIQKLLKVEDSCGEICYAWTTWNIMVETVKKVVMEGVDEREIDEEFKKYLEKVQKQKLSG